MNKYESPCNTGNCEFLPSMQNETSLCNRIANVLVEAGAAGVFEATQCPFEAVQMIAAKDTERTAELREKLGIVGLVQSEDTF